MLRPTPGHRELCDEASSPTSSYNSGKFLGAILIPKKVPGSNDSKACAVTRPQYAAIEEALCHSS